MLVVASHGATHGRYLPEVTEEGLTAEVIKVNLNEPMSKIREVGLLRSQALVGEAPNDRWFLHATVSRTLWYPVWHRIPTRLRQMPVSVITSHHIDHLDLRVAVWVHSHVDART